MTEELTCPYCGHNSDPCDFPDWLWADGDVELYPEQYQILLEIQAVGFNAVTCGQCGSMFLHRCGNNQPLITRDKIEDDVPLVSWETMAGLLNGTLSND